MPVICGVSVPVLCTVIVTMFICVLLTAFIPVCVLAGIRGQIWMIDIGIYQPALGICGKYEKRPALREQRPRFRNRLPVRIGRRRMLEPDNIHARRNKLHFQEGAIHSDFQRADPVFMGMVMSFCRFQGRCKKNSEQNHGDGRKRYLVMAGSDAAVDREAVGGHGCILKDHGTDPYRNVII